MTAHRYMDHSHKHSLGDVAIRVVLGWRPVRTEIFGQKVCVWYNNNVETHFVADRYLSQEGFPIDPFDPANSWRHATYLIYNFDDCVLSFDGVQWTAHFPPYATAQDRSGPVAVCHAAIMATLSGLAGVRYTQKNPYMPKEYLHVLETQTNEKAE